MPTIYETPTTEYPWPTGERLTSRLRIKRGLTVITDGQGGWTTTQFPYQGVLSPLVDGTDYFLGGHQYEIDCDTALSLYNAGFFPGYPESSCAG